MPTIHHVTVQLDPPKDDFPGRVTEGYYVIDPFDDGSGGVLVMTHNDGKPVDPVEFRHILEPSDNPTAIAMMMTRKVRRHLLGLSETQEKFARKIEYPKMGAA